MTIAKENIRLGFSEQRDRTEDDVVAFARWVFLRIVHDVEPEVLRSLAKFKRADSPRLAKWAARWHLADAWCLAHARATVTARQSRPTMPMCWVDRDDQSGAIYRPRHGRQAERPKKDPAHLRMLAEFQIHSHNYADIGQMFTVSPEAVRDAVTRTAKVIQLTLRPVPRGGARRLPRKSR